MEQGMCMARVRQERETEALLAGGSSVNMAQIVAMNPRTEFPLVPPTVSHWHNTHSPWGSSGTGRETAQPQPWRLARWGHWCSLCDHICSWGKAGAATGGGTSLQHPAHPRAQPGAPRGGHRMAEGDCTRGCERKARVEA